MEYATFVRKPFTVEAIEITEENIEELSKFIGQLRRKDNGQICIKVDRRLIPNIYWVYPGFWMTRMGGNIRCYSKKVFNEQFRPMDPMIEEWVLYMDKNTEKPADG